MPRLLAIAVAFLAQRVAALVSTPSMQHLAIDRTPADHHGAAAAAPGATSFYEGAVDVGQGRGENVLDVINVTVYGSLPLLVSNPKLAVMSAATTSAARIGVSAVAAAANRQVQQLSVSLAVLDTQPVAVRVSFAVTFASFFHRQGFLRQMLQNGIAPLATSICAGVSNGCQLPEDHPTAVQNGSVSLVSVEAVSPSAGANGTIFVRPWVALPEFFSTQNYRAAVEAAIAYAALVSQLEVTTLMSVHSADTVRVDFWLLTKEDWAEDAVRRVKAVGDDIDALAKGYFHTWSKGADESALSPMWGRATLDVPVQFAGSASARTAVLEALREVAERPVPQGPRLSLNHFNCSLALANRSVQVRFEVNFSNPVHRQVFASDFARNGGELLASRINRLLPNMCNDSCLLPGFQKGQVASPLTNVFLGQPFGRIILGVSQPQLFVRDAGVQASLEVAISMMAGVPRKQVGLLLTAEHAARVRVEYWVTSSNTSLRQATVVRIKEEVKQKAGLCAMAVLDRDVEDATYGSIALQAADARSFAGNATVRQALTAAISEVVGLPRQQVHAIRVYPDPWDTTLKAVRVDFRLDLLGHEGRQAQVTLAIARDGAQNLTRRINASLPPPFTCWLLGQNQSQASDAGNRSYGTMLVHVFLAPRFVGDKAVHDAMVRTIAEVASVQRPQVGILMRAESRSVVRINFWVASTNQTLRQAAVQRVNVQWSARNLSVAMARMQPNFTSPAFMVRGGTVNETGAVNRSQC